MFLGFYFKYIEKDCWNIILPVPLHKDGHKKETISIMDIIINYIKLSRF